MTLAFWALTALGWTWIVNRSFFFAWLRRLIPKPEGETPFFGVLIRCPQCLGFWIGASLHALGFVVAPAPVWTIPHSLADAVVSWGARAFFAGCAASGLCYVTNVVLNKLGQGPIEEYLAMARMEIWHGEPAMGSLIEAAIRRWDDKGEVAKNLQASPATGGDVALVATFLTKGDGQDAAAFADGFAEGYVTAVEDQDEPEEEEDESDDEGDDEDDPDMVTGDEDEDEDEDDDSGSDSDDEEEPDEELRASAAADRAMVKLDDRLLHRAGRERFVGRLEALQ